MLNINILFIKISRKDRKGNRTVEVTFLYITRIEITINLKLILINKYKVSLKIHSDISQENVFKSH